MALSTEQAAIVKQIVKIGRQMKVSPKELKAAIETGRVETNFSNPVEQTDHDSQGWRQERASLYKNPTNLTASITRFFRETRANRGKYGNAGELAAAVQRPAAAYRGRYAEQGGLADQLLDKYAGKKWKQGVYDPGMGGGVGPVGHQQKVALVAPAVAPSSNRREVLASYLLNRHDPSALVTALSSIKETPGSPAKYAAVAEPDMAGGAEYSDKPAGADAALGWAKSTIGTSESTGANRGPRIDQWQQRFGLKGQAWCAMFTSLAATKGGMPSSGRTPSVAEVRKQAQSGSKAYQRGFIDPRQAKPGDLILKGNDHIGMVESVGPDGITMIAGNDSDKVQQRKVTFTYGDVVRPKYAA